MSSGKEQNLDEIGSPAPATVKEENELDGQGGGSNHPDLQVPALDPAQVMAQLVASMMGNGLSADHARAAAQQALQAMLGPVKVGTGDQSAPMDELSSLDDRDDAGTVTGPLGGASQRPVLESDSAEAAGGGDVAAVKAPSGKDEGSENPMLAVLRKAQQGQPQNTKARSLDSLGLSHPPAETLETGDDPVAVLDSVSLLRCFEDFDYLKLDRPEDAGVEVLMSPDCPAWMGELHLAEIVENAPAVWPSIREATILRVRDRFCDAADSWAKASEDPGARAMVNAAKVSLDSLEDSEAAPLTSVIFLAWMFDLPARLAAKVFKHYSGPDYTCDAEDLNYAHGTSLHGIHGRILHWVLSHHEELRRSECYRFDVSALGLGHDISAVDMARFVEGLDAEEIFSTPMKTEAAAEEKRTEQSEESASEASGSGSNNSDSEDPIEGQLDRSGFSKASGSPELESGSIFVVHSPTVKYFDDQGSWIEAEASFTEDELSVENSKFSLETMGVSYSDQDGTIDFDFIAGRNVLVGGRSGPRRSTRARQQFKFRFQMEQSPWDDAASEMDSLSYFHAIVDSNLSDISRDESTRLEVMTQLSDHLDPDSSIRAMSWRPSSSDAEQAIATELATRLFQPDPSVSHFNEPGAAELSAVGISEMQFESKSGFRKSKLRPQVRFLQDDQTIPVSSCQNLQVLGLDTNGTSMDHLWRDPPPADLELQLFIPSVVGGTAQLPKFMVTQTLTEGGMDIAVPVLQEQLREAIVLEQRIPVLQFPDGSGTEYVLRYIGCLDVSSCSRPMLQAALDSMMAEVPAGEVKTLPMGLQPLDCQHLPKALPHGYDPGWTPYSGDPAGSDDPHLGIMMKLDRERLHCKAALSMQMRADEAHRKEHETLANELRRDVKRQQVEKSQLDRQLVVAQTSESKLKIALRAAEIAKADAVAEVERGSLETIQVLTARLNESQAEAQANKAALSDARANELMVTEALEEIKRKQSKRSTRLATKIAGDDAQDDSTSDSGDEEESSSDEDEGTLSDAGSRVGDGDDQYDDDEHQLWMVAEDSLQEDGDDGIGVGLSSIKGQPSGFCSPSTSQSPVGGSVAATRRSPSGNKMVQSTLGDYLPAHVQRAERLAAQEQSPKSIVGVIHVLVHDPSLGSEMDGSPLTPRGVEGLHLPSMSKSAAQHFEFDPQDTPQGHLFALQLRSGDGVVAPLVFGASSTSPEVHAALELHASGDLAGVQALARKELSDRFGFVTSISKGTPDTVPKLGELRCVSAESGPHWVQSWGTRTDTILECHFVVAMTKRQSSQFLSTWSQPDSDSSEVLKVPKSDLSSQQSLLLDGPDLPGDPCWIATDVANQPYWELHRSAPFVSVDRLAATDLQDLVLDHHFSMVSLLTRPAVSSVPTVPLGGGSTGTGPSTLTQALAEQHKKDHTASSRETWFKEMSVRIRERYQDQLEVLADGVELDRKKEDVGKFMGDSYDRPRVFFSIIKAILDDEKQQNSSREFSPANMRKLMRRILHHTCGSKASADAVKYRAISIPPAEYHRAVEERFDERAKKDTATASKSRLAEYESSLGHDLDSEGQSAEIPIEFYAECYVSAFSSKTTMAQTAKDIINRHTLRSFEQLTSGADEDLKELGLHNVYDVMEELALALEELETSEFYDRGKSSARAPALINSMKFRFTSSGQKILRDAAKTLIGYALARVDQEVADMPASKKTVRDQVRKVLQADAVDRVDSLGKLWLEECRTLAARPIEITSTAEGSLKISSEDSTGDGDRSSADFSTAGKWNAIEFDGSHYDRLIEHSTELNQVSDPRFWVDALAFWWNSPRAFPPKHKLFDAGMHSGWEGSWKDFLLATGVIKPKQVWMPSTHALRDEFVEGRINLSKPKKKKPETPNPEDGVKGASSPSPEPSGADNKDSPPTAPQSPASSQESKKEYLMKTLGHTWDRATKRAEEIGLPRTEDSKGFSKTILHGFTCKHALGISDIKEGELNLLDHLTDPGSESGGICLYCRRFEKKDGASEETPVDHKLSDCPSFQRREKSEQFPCTDKYMKKRREFYLGEGHWKPKSRANLPYKYPGPDGVLPGSDDFDASDVSKFTVNRHPSFQKVLQGFKSKQGTETTKGASGKQQKKKKTGPHPAQSSPVKVQQLMDNSFLDDERIKNAVAEIAKERRSTWLEGAYETHIKAVAGLQSTGGGVVPDSAVSDDTKRFEIDMVPELGRTDDFVKAAAKIKAVPGTRLVNVPQGLASKIKKGKNYQTKAKAVVRHYAQRGVLAVLAEQPGSDAHKDSDEAKSIVDNANLSVCFVAQDPDFH